MAGKIFLLLQIYHYHIRHGTNPRQKLIGSFADPGTPGVAQHHEPSPGRTGGALGHMLSLPGSRLGGLQFYKFGDCCRRSRGAAQI